jgi:hypothetical protein
MYSVGLNTFVENNFNSSSAISSKRVIALKIFWSGVVLYTATYAFKQNVHTNLKAFESIQLIGILLFIPTAIYVSAFRIKNGYFKLFFFIYCTWSLFVISRGILFDYDSVKTMLVDANYGIFIYLAPLIILIPRSFTFYKILFDAIYILAILFVLFSIVFIHQLLDRSFATQDVIEYLTKFLALPSGFILLTYKYHSNRKKLIAFAVMIASFLFSIYKARRGLSTICLSVLIAFYFIYLFNVKKKVLLIYLPILILAIGSLYISTLYNINNHKFISFIVSRGDEDTRTGVELYFYDDMKTNNWIIGKGINGEYFCPDIDENQLTDYRPYIETGYLQIILKGGIINLALYLLIIIPAIINGFFFSKNILSKASAIWILISMYSLYPSTVNTFSMYYLLVWISVGICYSKEIRQLSDNEIKEFLLNSSSIIKESL